MTTQLNFVLVLFWARPLLPEEQEDRGDVASSVKLQSAERRRRRRRRRSQKILHRVVSCCCCCSSCPMIYESPALLLLLLSQSLSMLLLLLSCNRAQQKNILWTLSPPGPSPACCCCSSSSSPSCWSWQRGPNEAGSENKHLRGTQVAVASRRRSVRSLVRSFSHLLSLSYALLLSLTCWLHSSIRSLFFRFVVRTTFACAVFGHSRNWLLSVCFLSLRG